MGERKLATYDDVLSAPPSVIAELIAGELHTHPRPRLRHAAAATTLGSELEPAFGRGRGGPGGWIILAEPELHLGSGPDVLVPDLAGWHRSRMPELPDEPYATLAPDWTCEVLSRSTEAFDRTAKLPIYAREQVSHVWLVDPDVETLEVFRLDGETYRLVLTASGTKTVRAEPFDAIELALQELWRR